MHSNCIFCRNNSNYYRQCNYSNCNWNYSKTRWIHIGTPHHAIFIAGLYYAYGLYNMPSYFTWWLSQVLSWLSSTSDVVSECCLVNVLSLSRSQMIVIQSTSHAIQLSDEQANYVIGIGASRRKVLLHHPVSFTRPIHQLSCRYSFRCRY